MKRFSTTIEIEFLGYEGYMAPSNAHNKNKIRQAAQSEDVQKYFEVIQWYQKKEDEIKGDKDYKDLTDEESEKLIELSNEFEEKVSPHTEGLIEYRKKVVDIIVKEWKDQAPPEELYTDEYWDSWAFSELQNFFMNPNPILSSRQ